MLLENGVQLQPSSPYQRFADPAALKVTPLIELFL